MSTFKLFIERLRGGKTQPIVEMFSPDFLGPNEPELRFPSPVKAKGEAYLTDDHLIIHLKAETKIEMPCSVCNKMIDAELKVDNLYHTEPIANIPSGVFDFSEPLREALLIELPRTVECLGGNCPDREIIKPYLHSEMEEGSSYLPFSGLDDLK